MKDKKNILKNIEGKTSSENFTSKIMENIYALENETILSEQFKESTLLKTSNNFTENILFEIEKEKEIFKPVEIFSKNQLTALISTVIILITIALTSKSNDTIFTSIEVPKLPTLNFQIQFPPIFIIVVFSFSILLYLDYYIKTYKKG